MVNSRSVFDAMIVASRAWWWAIGISDGDLDAALGSFGLGWQLLGENAQQPNADTPGKLRRVNCCHLGKPAKIATEAHPIGIASGRNLRPVPRPA